MSDGLNYHVRMDHCLYPLGLATDIRPRKSSQQTEQMYTNNTLNVEGVIKTDSDKNSDRQ